MIIRPSQFLGPIFLLMALSGCFWATPTDIGLEDGRLKPCPDSPNCVSSYADDRHSIEPLQFETELPRVRDRLVELLRDQYHARVVTRNDTYVHATISTTLGFIDDLEFQFDPATNTIHVRSASRVGRSDLGANRERIQELRRRLSEPLTK